ncbi:MAG: hypothetical protein AAF799_09190 [Myxococcota bacterium]
MNKPIATEQLTELSQTALEDSDLAFDACFTEAYVMPSPLRSKFVESVNCGGKTVLFTVDSDGSIYCTIEQKSAKTGWSAPTKIPYVDSQGNPTDGPSLAELRSMSATVVDDGRAFLVVCTQLFVYVALCGDPSAEPDQWSGLVESGVGEQLTFGDWIQAVAAGSLPHVANNGEGDLVWFGIQQGRSVSMFSCSYFQKHPLSDQPEAPSPIDVITSIRMDGTSNEYGAGPWRGEPSSESRDILVPLQSSLSSAKKGCFLPGWGCGNIVCSRDAAEPHANLVFAVTGRAKDDGSGDKNTKTQTQCVLTCVAGSSQLQTEPGSSVSWSFQSVGRKRNVQCTTGQSDTNINAVLALDLVCLPGEDESSFALALAFFADKVERNSGSLSNVVNIMYLNNTSSGDGNGGPTGAGNMANIGRFHDLGLPGQSPANYPDILRVAQLLAPNDDTSQGVFAMCVGGSNHVNNEYFSGMVAVDAVIPEGSDRYENDGAPNTGTSVADAKDNSENELPPFGPFQNDVSAISATYFSDDGSQASDQGRGNSCVFFTAVSHPDSLSPITSWPVSDPSHDALNPIPISADATREDPGEPGDQAPFAVPVYSVQFIPSPTAPPVESGNYAAHASDRPILVRASVPSECLIDGRVTFLTPDKWTSVPVGCAIAITSHDLSAPTLEFSGSSPNAEEGAPAVVLPTSAVATRLSAVTADEIRNPVDNTGLPLGESILPAERDPTDDSYETCATVSNDLCSSVLGDDAAMRRGFAPRVPVHPTTGHVEIFAQTERTGALPYTVSFTRSDNPDRWTTSEPVCASLVRVDRAEFYRTLAKRTGEIRPLLHADVVELEGLRPTRREVNESPAAVAEWVAEHKSALMASGVAEADIDMLAESMSSQDNALFASVHRLVQAGKLLVEKYEADMDSKVLSFVLCGLESGIRYAWHIVNWTANQAMSVVSDIYAAFATAYQTMRKWLSWMFDWNTISDVADVVQVIFDGSCTLAAAAVEGVGKKAHSALGTIRTKIDEAFEGLESSKYGNISIGQALGLTGHDMPSDFSSRPNAVSDSETVGGHNPLQSPSSMRRAEFTSMSSPSDELDPLDLTKATVGDKLHWNESGEQSVFDLLSSFFHRFNPSNILDITVNDVLEAFRSLLDWLLDAADGAIDVLTTAFQDALIAFQAYGSSPLYIPVVSELLQFTCGLDTGQTTPSRVASYLIAVPLTFAGQLTAGHDMFSKDQLSQLKAKVEADISAAAAWLSGGGEGVVEVNEDIVYDSYTLVLNLASFVNKSAAATCSILMPSTGVPLKLNPDGVTPMQRYPFRPGRIGLGSEQGLGGLVGSSLPSFFNLLFKFIGSALAIPLYRNPLYGKSSTQDHRQWELWAPSMVANAFDLTCFVTQGNAMNGVQCSPVVIDFLVGNTARVCSIAQAGAAFYEALDAEDNTWVLAYDAAGLADSIVGCVGGLFNMLNTMDTNTYAAGKAFYDPGLSHGTFLEAPMVRLPWAATVELLGPEIALEPARFVLWNLSQAYSAYCSATAQAAQVFAGKMIIGPLGGAEAS